MTETALDFTQITIPAQMASPMRVLGEYSFGAYDTGTTVWFRVEEPLSGGQFTCAASHICQDAALRNVHQDEQHGTVFAADTAEGALQKAIDHFAVFLSSPDAKSLRSEDRLRRNQDWLVTPVRVG